METFLLLVLIGIAVAIYIRIPRRSDPSYLPATADDWLMEVRTTDAGNRKCMSLYFHPIVAWKQIGPEYRYLPHTLLGTVLTPLDVESDKREAEYFHVRGGMTYRTDYSDGAHYTPNLALLLQRKVTSEKLVLSDGDLDRIPSAYRSCVESAIAASIEMRREMATKAVNPS